MTTASPVNQQALPGPGARRLLLELRHNLDVLEPLFQRGREAASPRHGPTDTLLQPLYDAAAQLQVAALESALAELMAADDSDEDLWVPRTAGQQGPTAWNDGARLRQLYVQAIAALAMAAAQRAGRRVDGDIAERLRGLRRGFQQVFGLLSAEIGEPGWRDVAARVLAHLVPRRPLPPAPVVAADNAANRQDQTRSAA
jgi:hypothetical protein